MRMLLWTVSFVCLGLWSLLAWGATGLVGAAQSWFPAFGEDPLSLGFTAANWADWLGLAGQGVILVIWAIGAIAILVGTALLSRGLGAIGRIAGARRASGRSISSYPPYPPYPPYRPSGSSMGRLAARLAPRLLRAVRR
jgi:hypothetical protein